MVPIFWAISKMAFFTSILLMGSRWWRILEKTSWQKWVNLEGWTHNSRCEGDFVCPTRKMAATRFKIVWKHFWTKNQHNSFKTGIFSQSPWCVENSENMADVKILPPFLSKPPLFYSIRSKKLLCTSRSQILPFLRNGATPISSGVIRDNRPKRDYSKLSSSPSCVVEMQSRWTNIHSISHF